MEKLQKVAVAPQSITFYQGIIDDELLDEVVELGRQLKGLRVVKVNATAYGGGVAEIFKSMVPLMESVGIKTDWLVMPADDDFFAVTKGFHNALQGADFDLTAQAKEIYLRHNQRTAELLAREQGEIYEIHDPQPLAIIDSLEMPNSIWRCHIDTTTPNPAVWDFLTPFIRRYQELIFTLPEFVHPGVGHDSINYFPPAIDPLSVKNTPMELTAATGVVAAFGIDTARPLITQVSRFDPWKDPKGVIDAYRLVKEKVPEVQLALVGSMANDDPEGQEIYREIEEYAGPDPDVFLLTNLGGVGEAEVNAFQTFSHALVQKSIREGFGLTVTEGMWKGKPVVGGNVGGIKAQINDGETGYLVDSVEECADRLTELLTDGEKIDEMGRRAKAYARSHFLIPRLIRDHLRLYQKMLG